ncbi:MAG: hypothetical protein JWN27_1334 [Candidatus Eremiobacteraeota bacterium]|nr:hypothetical protein [Candidatus Eremiobacteraeota bacterium]
MQNDLQRSTQSILPVWRAALSDETAFGEAVTPQVRLEGSIYAAPLSGREKVWIALRTAGGITEALNFIHESTTSDRSYLEWELEALGQRFEGVTVLSFDSSGLIDKVALHHRPLGGVLAFSAEMGRRLGNSLGPDMFFQAPEGT